MPEYKWREISDLPAELLSYRDRELEALTQVWEEQRATIGSEESVAEFNRQLAREWSIETGIIEGVYTLDRGVTETLIERGLKASLIPHEATNRDPELVARIIQSHEEVLEGLFSFVKSERTLSPGYIKELHASLLRYADTIDAVDQFGNPFSAQVEKGVYKTLPNSPRQPEGAIHEYCHPDHVAAEMDRLIQFHQQHVQKHVPALAEAAWLHHAFTQIHPFQDGNGRVARSLASVVLIKAGYFPLVVRRDDREGYIDALEAADNGQLDRFVEYFSKLQKRELTKAIGRIADMKPVTSLEDALTVTRDLLINVGRIAPREYLVAKDHAAKLANSSEQQLNRIASKLGRDISRADSKYEFQVATSNIPPKEGLLALAGMFDYDPDPDIHYYAPALLLKVDGRLGSIVVSFCGIGPAFRGLLAAVVYFQSGSREPIPLSDGVFQFNYRDDFAEMEGRFVKWLEAALIQGLAEWRRTLV
jgi:Fic family protein